MEVPLHKFCIGTDLAMDPHGGCGEKHDVHSLGAIECHHWFAKHEGVAEREGADFGSCLCVDYLGVELVALVV